MIIAHIFGGSCYVSSQEQRHGALWRARQVPGCRGGLPHSVQLLPAVNYDVKYSSKISCWFSTKLLSEIIYEHKPGAPRTNTKIYNQQLLSTTRVLSHSHGAQALEVFCNLPVPLATKFYFYLFFIYSQDLKLCHMPLC